MTRTAASRFNRSCLHHGLRRFLLALLLAILLQWPFYADSSRIALVIGNAAYHQPRFPTLTNPCHDAQDLAQTLERLCFEVILVQDASRAVMRAAIEAFGRRLAATGGMGLFYYSGHGIQYQQQNYLIPVDAIIREDQEIPGAALDANLVLTQMEVSHNATNILIFDTCRDTPTLTDVAKGFVAMTGPTGSVIVFASALGQTAYGDTTHRNSLYTRHFITALQEAVSRDILEILRDVNRRVAAEAAVYQVTPETVRALQQVQLPAPILQKLQHPLLYQQVFTETQFMQIVQEQLLADPQDKRYLPEIVERTRQAQEPWLYTNLTEKIVLTADCNPKPSVGQFTWKSAVGLGVTTGATVTALALLANRNTPEIEFSFTGTFQRTYTSHHTMPGFGELTIQNEELLTLQETDTRITGSLKHHSLLAECCDIETTVPVSGTRRSEQTAYLTYAGAGVWCTCRGTSINIATNGRQGLYTLSNRGQALQGETEEFKRAK